MRSVAIALRPRPRVALRPPGPPRALSRIVARVYAAHPRPVPRATLGEACASCGEAHADRAYGAVRFCASCSDRGAVPYDELGWG